MPKVPQYQGNRVQLEQGPRVRVNTQAPLEAFGGGQAAQIRGQAERGLADAGTGLVDFMNREKQKADRVRLKEFDIQLDREQTRLLYDRQEGALNKQGRDAFSIVDKYEGDFDKFFSEQEKSLSNESQRQQARELYNQRKAGLNKQLMQHTFSESEKYSKDLSEAVLANSRNDAMLNYQDPELLQQAIDRQKQEVVNFALDNGLPNEWVKMKTEDAVSKTHVGVIERMLATGQDVQAKTYFDAFKDQVGGNDQMRVEKYLEEGSTRGEAQRIVDGYMKQYSNMTQAIEASRGIENIKVRDEVVNRIKGEFSARKAAQDDYQNQIFEKGSKLLEVNNGNLDEYVQQNMTEWMTMGNRERSALQSQAKNIRERRDPETNLTTYYDLMSLASNPQTSNEFVRENLLLYRHELSQGDFKKIVDMQASLQKGDDKMLSGIRSSMQIATDAMSSAGIDKKKKPELYAEFMRRMDEEKIRYQERTGKPPGTEEIQRIADELTIKGKVPGTGWFFEDKKFKFELEPGQQIRMNFKQIPRKDKLEIEEVLRAKGVPITEDAVLDLYIKGQQ